MVKARHHLSSLLFLFVFLLWEPSVFPLQAETFLPFRALAGTTQGLFFIARSQDEARILPLWQGGEVKKILVQKGRYLLLTDQGILVSSNLRDWEPRNQGLPMKTLKIIQGNKKTFLQQVQDIKDLELHPDEPDLWVCATREGVFITYTAGQEWLSLGMPPAKTNGIKAVAVGSFPELTVFASHSIYGVFFLSLQNRNNRIWQSLNRGLELHPTTANPDEVADILVLPSPKERQILPQGDEKNQSPGQFFPLYAVQTFQSRLYALSWQTKTFESLWKGPEKTFMTLDSLRPWGERLIALSEGKILAFVPSTTNYKAFQGDTTKEEPKIATSLSSASSQVEVQAYEVRPETDLKTVLDVVKETVPGYLNGIVLCSDSPSDPSLLSGTYDAALLPSPSGKELTLSELYLLDHPSVVRNSFAAQARAKEGIYLPVNHALSPQSLAHYLSLMNERTINLVVIDMKDDYGRLRFSPRNPRIAAKGRVFNPINLDSFLATMKKQSIYTVARIVVFKDPELAKKEGGRYAVWDKTTNSPWRGYYETKAPVKDAQGLEKIETNRVFYDESWVDPYSEVVWQYIGDIAKELQDRGFDEIQFDYIRFPTDGINLHNATYRWKEAGMDMESAILSFLRYMRSILSVPISIDIYGANGWYRTGARTGQELEVLSRYADIVCPMYYPSHFEQTFMAQEPAELRPYRIYYQGTLRSQRISRNRALIRPYGQAFFLNVSYDRKYYGPTYVLYQLLATRDAGKAGIIYWNNGGRYDEIPLPEQVLSIRSPLSSFDLGRTFSLE
ncbi:MAG: putative glycoside hydrolase [Treponemataceae bacterium]|nr:putative glycoside hydrolase [Treponemataceae bacterium]